MMALPFDISVVCPVLIGRTASLASFERVFEQVRSGQGQTVLVSGEASSGERHMSKEINLHRHRFLGTAAMTIVAAQLGMITSAKAQSNTTTPAAAPTTKPGTNTSFGSLKQINAGVLHVGYAE